MSERILRCHVCGDVVLGGSMQPVSALHKTILEKAYFGAQCVCVLCDQNVPYVPQGKRAHIGTRQLNELRRKPGIRERFAINRLKGEI